MANMIKLNNYKVLFSLRILKSILTTFVDSFLVLYFLTLSDSNILPLGIYRIVSITVIFITIFLLKNICKSTHRISLLRIGILLDFIYFLTIFLLKDQIINYMYIVGILYGLEEGFYFSAYNVIESDGITNQERAKFTGHYTIAKATLSIIFPIIFGSLIATTSFIKSIVVVLIIIILRLTLSFLLKMINISSQNKADLTQYKKIIKDNKIIKQVYKINVFNGLTYSVGAFQSIVTIYIIKVFSNSFSLGMFTSIFSLLSCLSGFLFARKIKQNNYPKIIKITMPLTIISLCIMIIKCNMLTIILFNFFQTISKDLVDLINGYSQANLSNLDSIRKEYKVEYYLGIEFSLFIGRLISQSLFILMAFIDSMYIIPLFIFFLIMLMINSLKLQNYTLKMSKYF